VGLRHVQILALENDGYPLSTDTSAYEGVTISGVRALTLEDPEPQQIVHRGDDRIFALDTLPPSEPISGELRTGKVNDAVDAVLTDDASVTVGETKLFGAGTDNRGGENQVALLAYRQTLDSDPSSANFGARRWEFRLLPRAYVIPREGGFDENPEERLYTVRPMFITKYPWGVDFDASTEGFTQAQVIRGVSEYKPKLVAWKGDNATVTFSLPTASPAASTDKITVWVNGTETTPSTVTTTQFTLGSTPSTDAEVVAFYEVA
jgi:hypothetical protein